MELALNELSLSKLEHFAQAVILYDTFFECCLKIEEIYKVKVGVSYSNQPQYFSFHPDITFLSWLNSRRTDDRRSILSMLTSEQIVLNYPYYKVINLEGIGIGYAHENNLFCISFSTKEEWKNDYLQVNKIRIEDDSFIEEQISLENLSNKESLDNHKNLVNQKLERVKNIFAEQIKSGEELWVKREKLFPNLSFCGDLINSLKYLPGGKNLNNLLNRLMEMEKYFSGWETGAFDIKGISGDVRLESETRLNNYINDMTFLCPDGIERVFSLHCDYGVWGFRLHFFPDPTSRKCLIGYIGKKIGV